MAGSRMPGVGDRLQAEQLRGFFRRTVLREQDGQWAPYKDGCSTYWVPYSDQGQEDVWRDQITGRAMEYAEWNPGQPNGKESQNCAEAIQTWSPEDEQWNDTGCDQGTICTVCERESQPVLRLRGLCSESRLSDIFTPVNSGPRGDLGYLGLGSTNIVYNATTFLWVATKINDPAVWMWATSAASKASGLLGTSEWTVYNDSRECNPAFSYKVTLTLTGCSSAEFTCVDGSCISMERRCDGRVDCGDNSDEVGCATAAVLSSYSKEMNPPPLPRETQARVALSVQLRAILQLDELAEIMYVKYVLLTRWTDPGLDFHNLKRNANQNVLSEDERTRIWVPKVIFENTKATETTLLDMNSIIRILPNANFSYTKTELSHQQNIHIFLGANTQVEMSRSYETEFLCLYNMAWYPFDSQTCSLDYMLDVTANTFVELESGSLNYSGPVELTQYYVRQTVMRPYTSGDQRGVRVLVVLGRRLLSNVLTVYVPTVLLNVMGHVTVYFKPFFFEAIITVNLTVMLVLTTM
jgi:hypothetical protein